MSGRSESGCKSRDLIAWARSTRKNAVKLRKVTAAQRARIREQRCRCEEPPPPTALPDVADEPSGPMADTLVTVGGSAGAIASACEVIAALPATFRAAIVVALHGATEGDLVRIVRRCARHVVRWAVNGEPLREGCIYVAAPGHHVIVNPDRCLTVSRKPRVRFFRPSVDWLFESAAAAFEDRHIAVVLSGRLDDGAAGVRCVTRMGGVALAEDPAFCLFGAMPRAAVQTGCVTASLSRPRIAAELVRLTDCAVSPSEPPFSAT